MTKIVAMSLHVCGFKRFEKLLLWQHWPIAIELGMLHLRHPPVKMYSNNDWVDLCLFYATDQSGHLGYSVRNCNCFFRYES